MSCLEILGIIAFIISLLSFILMLWLNNRMDLLQKTLYNRTKATLEFLTNLVINAAADPKTLRRLIDDYSKNGDWRGGLSRDEDLHKYHICFEVPTKGTLKINDIEITVIKCI